MTTYIVRHGQTNYSKRYLVNGDPTKHIHLNEEGRQSLSRAWTILPLHAVATWLTSEFPRARQTTSLLMGVPAATLVVDGRLNELDYGEFEGSPFLEYAVWLDTHGAAQRPPGAAESQREGIRRMLSGVLAALEHPGPRVLVSHGLLVSVLLWHRDRSPDDPIPLFFSRRPRTSTRWPYPMTSSPSSSRHCWTILIRAFNTNQPPMVTRRYCGSARGRRLLPSMRYPHPTRWIKKGSSSCMTPAP
ncbi:hypothetical protein GCM10020254_40220 [Streptomyces goshikiensis]